MKNNIKNMLILGSVAVLAIVIPTVLVLTGIMGPYVAGILTLAGINAIMAISVNLISGITGQLSLGQAGFMAIGAYSTILFSTIGNIPVPISVLLAGIVTAIFGFFGVLGQSRRRLRASSRPRYFGRLPSLGTNRRQWRRCRRAAGMRVPSSTYAGCSPPRRQRFCFVHPHTFRG